jgi:hypothetical protein
LSSAEITKAWIKFYKEHPEIADKLINSDINFVFSFGKDIALGDTGIGERGENGNVTKVTVNISEHFKGSTDKTAYVMAHEIAHCYGYTINPKGVAPSIYEEVIAMKFQYSFGKEIGYVPEISWWNTWGIGDKLKIGQIVVERALKVELTGEDSPGLRKQLTEAFVNSSYNSPGSGYSFYGENNDECWSRMDQLTNVFLK